MAYVCNLKENLINDNDSGFQHKAIPQLILYPPFLGMTLLQDYSVSYFISLLYYSSATKYSKGFHFVSFVLLSLLYYYMHHSSSIFMIVNYQYYCFLHLSKKPIIPPILLLKLSSTYPAFLPLLLAHLRIQTLKWLARSGGDAIEN